MAVSYDHRFSLEPSPLGCVSLDHVVREPDEDPLVLRVLQLQRANISYQARVVKVTACLHREAAALVVFESIFVFRALGRANGLAGVVRCVVACCIALLYVLSCHDMWYSVRRCRLLPSAPESHP